MKRLSVIITLALFSLVFGNLDVFSQNADRAEEFSGNWFIHVQGGAGHTVGESDFGSLISPSVAFGFGYRFTPVWSLRASIGGWKAKGALVSPESLYKFNYLQGNVDVTADICSVFSGYRMSRAVSPYLFAGIGVNGAFCNSEANNLINSFPADSYLWDGSKAFPAGRFGVGTGIRITNAVQFNIEIVANFLDDRFNSKHGSAVDWQINALAGFTFNIGLRQSAKRASATVANSVNTRNSVQTGQVSSEEPDKTNSLESENPQKPDAAIPSELSVKEPVFTEVRENIYFIIGRYDIRECEKSKISTIAGIMAGNKKTTVVISGYADVQTGSVKRNMYLSQKRAEAVASALTTAGIDLSRIKVIYKGSAEAPYSTPQENRVAICVITESGSY